MAIPRSSQKTLIIHHRTSGYGRSKSLPVEKLHSSEHSQATRVATALGSPTRLTGILARGAATASGDIWSGSPVPMRPGVTQLTRMPVSRVRARLGEADHPRLGRRIGRHGGVGLLPCHRDDVDDAPIGARPHAGDHRPAAQEDAAEINFYRAPPGRVVVVLQSVSPCPRLAPVITTTFPSRRPMAFSLSDCAACCFFDDRQAGPAVAAWLWRLGRMAALLCAPC